MVRGLEALHLPLSSACRSMRVLSTIVEVAALAMLDIRLQLPLRHATASQFIRDDHARYIKALEQTLEEPLGGFPVASLLNQDTEDDTILIHGTPQVMLDALDPDEHLVKVPLVARPRTAAEQAFGKALTKFLAPSSHR